MNPARLQKLLEMEAQNPNDPFIKYAIAQEHIAAGADHTALPYLEHLAQQHPDYLATYLHLGKLYERLGRVEQSLPTYQKGMQIAKAQNNLKTLSELQEAFFIAEDE